MKHLKKIKTSSYSEEVQLYDVLKGNSVKNSQRAFNKAPVSVQVAVSVQVEVSVQVAQNFPTVVAIKCFFLSN